MGKSKSSPSKIASTELPTFGNIKPRRYFNLQTGLTREQEKMKLKTFTKYSMQSKLRDFNVCFIFSREKD